MLLISDYFSETTGEDLKTTVLAQISTIEDSTKSASDPSNEVYSKIDSWRQLYLHLPSGVNQIVIEGKRSSDEQKSGILLDDIHLWPCKQEGNHVHSFIDCQTTHCHSICDSLRRVTVAFCKK